MPLYSLTLLLVLVLGAPFWLVRMATSGRHRRGLLGRLGVLPRGLASTARGRNVIWLHAVSVGEVLAAATLVRRLQAERPGWVVAVSTTTEAGQTLARNSFPGLPVFYFPLDFAIVVRRYLRVLRPQLLVLMESEFWPNLLRACGANGVPVAVVNARISDRSFPRYLRLRRLWRRVLAPVSLFLSQGEETAARLKQIGVPAGKVVVTGNLKYDSAAPAQGALFGQMQALFAGWRPLLVAGSTLSGEEALLLEAWMRIRRDLPDAAMLLAPRHPDRFAEAAALVERTTGSVHRASKLAADTRLNAGDVIVLDTIGDLAGLYELATAAFVGGSLVAAGGHNPLEPARFGVPVLLGPSYDNFREIVEAMLAGGGVRVLAPGEDLAAALLDLLRGGESVRALGLRGQAAFRSQAGATARTVEQLLALLPPLRVPAPSAFDQGLER